MVRRFLYAVLFAFILTLPAVALNTVGEVQQDLQLIGISIGNDAACPTVYAANGVVYKSYGAEDYPIGSKAVYFYFNAPPTQGDLKVNCTFGIAADLGAQAMFWCAYASTGFNQGSLVELQDVGNGRLYGGNYAGGLFGYQFTGVLRMTGDYQYIVIVVYPSSTSAVLQRGIDFASSGMVSQSGSSSGTVTQSGSASGTIDQSGHFGTNDVSLQPASRSSDSYVYTSDNTSTPIFKLYEGYDTIYINTPNSYIARATVIFPDYSGSLGGTLTSSGSSSSSISTSGSVSQSINTSGAVSQSITASAPNNIMAYGVCAVSYGDDDGLVDTVKHMDKTLDGVADNMQQIVDRANEEDNTADDIGTAAGDNAISNTGDTLSGGVGALDQSLETAGNVSSVSAGAGMYVGFLTATVSPLLNFGNGVLYWALFAIIILSVLVFILRRLDG